MSAVKALSVSGYKSIRELRDFPLTNLNVLIGANGAGKSNFISLFRLLNEIVEQRLQLYSQVQGGADALLHFGRKTSAQIAAKFYFDSYNNQPDQFDNYEFQLVPTQDNRLLLKNEAIGCAEIKIKLQEQDASRRKAVESDEKAKAALMAGAAALVLSDKNPWLALLGAGLGYALQEKAFRDTPLGAGSNESALKMAQDEISLHTKKSVNNWRVYHFQDTGDTANVKRVHASNINLRLLPDAGNLAAYLRMLYEKYPNQYRHIVDVIRLVAPFFDDFVHRPNNPEYVELEWTQVGRPDIPFKAHLLSDGTLRFMCLATLLLQPIDLLPDTILIDEPELGLHPYAISILADMLKQVAEKKQLIVSTQSVELVNEFTPEDIIVVEQYDGASTFNRFTTERLSGWLEAYSLGELWLQNVLGGRP